MTKEQMLLRAKNYAIANAKLNPDIKEKITPIYKEGNELLSIIVAAINTLRGK